MNNTAKKSLNITLASTTVLIILVFSMGLFSPAYAAHFTFLNSVTSNPFSKTDSGYFVNHGAMINFTIDPADNISPLPASFSVTLTDVNSTSSITLPFSQVGTSNNYTFSDYVMFTTNPTGNFLFRANQPFPHFQQNLQVASATKTSGDRIQASTINPLTGGQIVSQLVPLRDGNQITSTSYSTGPQPYYSGFGAKLTCPAPGVWDADHICSTWKTGSGLKIPMTKNSVTGTYSWQCSSDPNGPYKNPPIDFPCPANDSMKDVYVEIDWMQGQAPDRHALDNLKSVFLQHSIRLHFLLSEEIPHMNQITPTLPGTEISDFNNLKSNYFSNSTIRTNPDPAACSPAGSSVLQCQKNILTAERNVFHYLLMADDQSNLGGGTSGSSGAAEMVSTISPTPSGFVFSGTNDLMTTLGTFNGGVGSTDQQSGAIMHELGHTLDLDHGGPNAINQAQTSDHGVNCKPNYLSVMSWSREFSDLTTRPLDYESDTSLRSVTESPITEASVSTQAVNTVYETSSGTISQPIPANSAIIDWDQDGDSVSDTDAASEPSWALHNISQIGCSGNTATLQSYNDWNNLLFDMTPSSSFADGAGAAGTNYDYIAYIIIISLIIIVVILIILIVWSYMRRRHP